MCSSVVSQIIAFFLGIAASFLVWVFTTKVSRVKIVFSEELTGNTDPNNESLYHYNVEVTNKGKRDLIDLHIQAKITIVGADAKNPGLKCFALLNLDYSSNLPYLPPAGSRDKLWPNQNTGRIIYAVNMKDAYAEFSKVFYDPRIQSKARAKTLQLDDIFEAYPDAALQFHLFGYDAFTGARKMYRSKYYRREHLRAFSQPVARSAATPPPRSFPKLLSKIKQIKKEAGK